MPTVTSGKVLVTGANGYIAKWVVRTLLEKGYSVRGAVRSEGKAAEVRKLFAKYDDKLELVVIPDITKEGAFDEAVKGVVAIEHLASPCHLNAGHPDEITVPAVNGTKRVLEAAAAPGTSVKRIVITSSAAAVMQLLPTPRVFTESDWNDLAVAEITEKGRAASQVAKYCASKTLAERAAWKFVEENKGKVDWDLVVLNPPYVYGPSIYEAGAADAVSDSMMVWYKGVFESKDPKQLSSTGFMWIDVRDLAEVQALALQKEEAGGERVIVSAGNDKFQDWVNTLRECGVSTPASDDSYDPSTTTHHVIFDTSKSERLFGVKYRSMEDCTRDIVVEFKARGMI